MAKRQPKGNQVGGLTLYADSREKNPFDLVDGKLIISQEVKKLDTGDYTCLEFPDDWLCLERKASVSELYGCLTNQRTRFEKEIERMRSYKHKFIVIEAEAQDILDPYSYPWLRKMDSKRAWAQQSVAAKIIRSSLLGWALRDNIHFLFVGSNRIQSKPWLISIFDRVYKDLQRSQSASKDGD